MKAETTRARNARTLESQQTYLKAKVIQVPRYIVFGYTSPVVCASLDQALKVSREMEKNDGEMPRVLDMLTGSFIGYDLVKKEGQESSIH